MGRILAKVLKLMVEIIRKKEKLNWKETTFLLLVYFNGFAFGTLMLTKAFGAW